jgi:type II secretory pathway predicted ATPase ExeA
VGIPRAVNNLAIASLLATYAANKAIDESRACTAVTEVTTE